MSIRHSAWALHKAPVTSAAERLALVYLAEFVSDDAHHRGTLPPLADLAAVLHASEDGAARVLADLAAAGVLQLDAPVFELNLAGGDE